MIKKASTNEEINDALSVRDQVFALEQGIDRDVIFDVLDETADHFVAYLDGKPIGTLRVRHPEENVAKIERVAVLEEMRGKSMGLKLMEFTLEDLKKNGIKKAVLDSQSYIKSFYEKLGFVQIGDEFEEVGIPHVYMEKELNE